MMWSGSVSPLLVVGVTTCGRNSRSRTIVAAPSCGSTQPKAALVQRRHRVALGQPESRNRASLAHARGSRAPWPSRRPGSRPCFSHDLKKTGPSSSGSARCLARPRCSPTRPPRPSAHVSGPWSRRPCWTRLPVGVHRHHRAQPSHRCRGRCVRPVTFYSSGCGCAGGLGEYFNAIPPVD